MFPSCQREDRATNQTKVRSQSPVSCRCDAGNTARTRSGGTVGNCLAEAKSDAKLPMPTDNPPAGHVLYLWDGILEDVIEKKCSQSFDVAPVPPKNNVFPARCLLEVALAA
jgi:hypothetical protein